MANGNRYDVDSKALFSSGGALYAFKILSRPNTDYFWHTRICSMYM
jgi:hypothetical protein